MAVAASSLAGGASNTATTSPTFTAQAAGAWLVLLVSADDYRTTSGANRPESTSWTLQSAGEDFLGFYVWTKISTGSETTVSYTIGSASPSAWVVVAVTGAAGTLDLTPAATATHTHGGGSTTPSNSVTPTTGGNRYTLACCGAMHSTTSITAASSWSNSYSAVAFQAGPASGSREAVGAAGLAGTGGSATSSTVTWNAAQLCAQGVVLAFQQSGGGAPAIPPMLIMQTRRP